jgi:hypothetical protein
MKTASALLAASLSLAALAPSAHAVTGWAVTTENALISFDLSAPTSFLSTAGITGLRGHDGVSADPFGQILDLAQKDGQLFGLDGNANFYSLNASTGAATFLSNALAPLGYDAGLAYDPFFARFRFVSDAGENKLIDTAGNVTNAASLFYGAGDANFGTSVSFSGVAIDYDFGTGFALDAVNDTLAITYDANFAEFFTLGSLGLDITALASLDILSTGELFAALSTDSATSGLYQIDPVTGQATFVADFGTGITGIAFSTAAVPEPSTYGLFAGVAAIGLAVLRRRNRRA